jgi:hypothetical protein
MQALVHVIRAPQTPSNVDELTRLFGEGERIGDADLERFVLYRQLVHGRFWGALEVSIPRTIARIGAEIVKQDLTEFIFQHATTSIYMRDIAPEFIAFVSPRWRDQRHLPEYLIELATHELLTIDIAAALDDDEKSSIEAVDLETSLQFQRAAKLVQYRYAVHRLPEDETDHSEPAPGNWWILGYRDEEDRARFLELTPLAAAVLEKLMPGDCLHDAALKGCATTGTVLDDQALANIAVLLDDLEQRGVFIGAFSTKNGRVCSE